MNKTGVITSGIGGLYTVLTDGGETLLCRPRGKFRIGGIKPYVGDTAVVTERDDGPGVLNEILPRKNCLIRPAVSNIDTLLFVASQAPPVTETLLIDKVSAIAHIKNIRLTVCVNKSDINSDCGLFELYSRVGFNTIRTSAETGEGLDELKELLGSGITVLTGNSGVGKSSLLSRMYPRESIKIGDLSEKIGRGRQTTRAVKLFPLEGGGFIADTPGFSSFDVGRMDLVLKENLSDAFPDISEFAPDCTYRGCSHTKERGCAVSAAVKEGKIEPSRYKSYVYLYESMKNYKEYENNES